MVWEFSEARKPQSLLGGQVGQGGGLLVLFVPSGLGSKSMELGSCCQGHTNIESPTSALGDLTLFVCHSLPHARAEQERPNRAKRPSHAERKVISSYRLLSIFYQFAGPKS